MAQESWEREQGSAGCKQSDRNILCANNCGFFGSAATLNMCSQCYGEHVAKTMQAAAATATTTAAAATSSSPNPSASAQRTQSPVALRTDPCPSGATSGCGGGSGSGSGSGIAAPVSSRGAENVQRTSFPGATHVMPVEPSANPFATRKEEIDVRGQTHPARSSIDTRASSAAPSAAAAAAAVAAPALPCGGGSSSSSSGSRAIRCMSCKRRVGLTGFKCRCGDMFCAIHRYSDKHACSFDYKTAGREAIAKANPIVKADKVARF